MNHSRIPALAIGALLALALLLTRGHHFASLEALPSASWAVFFLGGVFLRRALPFALLVALAAALDFAAVTWGGVSGFCTSPAYPFLLPAYGSLWLAGRWFSQRHGLSTATLLPFAGSALVGAHLCELISSGAFYVFSGRFADPTLVGFGERLVRYYPKALEAFGFWLAVALLLAFLVAALTSTRFASQAARRG